MTLFDLSLGEELECPGIVCNGTYGTGCCVKIGLQCCPDGLYCVKDASTMCSAEGSPPKPYAPAPEYPSNESGIGRKLLSLKATDCPGGSCIEDGWFCCDDNQYCAETESDCPNFLNTAMKLSRNGLPSFGRKLLSLKTTPCPGGTCEEDGWFCCDDNQYCAETESDCPNFLESAKKLSANVKIMPCPGGTCEEDGWFCCDDNKYCAETENDCPNFLSEPDFLPLV